MFRPKTIMFLLVLAALSACKGKNKSETGGNNVLSDQAIALSAEFVARKFSYADIRTGKDAITTISESASLLMTSKTEYLIDPSKVYTGDLDGNGEDDAIVTIACNKDGFPHSFEHLVFISAEGILSLNSASESNMTVFGIHDGVITAEVHSHPPSSPLYDCEACKEVVKLRFEKGSFIRIEP